VQFNLLFYTATVENPEVVLATVVCECFLAQIAVELAGFADFDCYQAN